MRASREDAPYWAAGQVAQHQQFIIRVISPRTPAPLRCSYHGRMECLFSWIAMMIPGWVLLSRRGRSEMPRFWRTAWGYRLLVVLKWSCISETGVPILIIIDLRHHVDAENRKRYALHLSKPSVLWRAQLQAESLFIRKRKALGPIAREKGADSFVDQLATDGIEGAGDDTSSLHAKRLILTKKNILYIYYLVVLSMNGLYARRDAFITSFDSTPFRFLTNSLLIYYSRVTLHMSYFFVVGDYDRRSTPYTRQVQFFPPPSTYVHDLSVSQRFNRCRNKTSSVDLSVIFCIRLSWLYYEYPLPSFLSICLSEFDENGKQNSRRGIKWVQIGSQKAT